MLPLQLQMIQIRKCANVQPGQAVEPLFFSFRYGRAALKEEM
jgi:hypothetical protein